MLIARVLDWLVFPRGSAGQYCGYLAGNTDKYFPMPHLRNSCTLLPPILIWWMSLEILQAVHILHMMKPQKSEAFFIAQNSRQKVPIEDFFCLNMTTT